METQIHLIEQEAYCSVLRAFKAQSDAITWVAQFFFFLISVQTRSIRILTLLSFFYFQDKESLITELRKELRVSDEEHRELLSRVNADDVIRRIRSDSIMTCYAEQFHEKHNYFFVSSIFSRKMW